MTIDYNICDVVPYINWAYFYFAWQVKQKKEQQRLHDEALSFLTDIADKYRTHALIEIMPAYGDGDDIVIKTPSATHMGTSMVRIPCLRQQSGSTCLCLADFIAPHSLPVTSEAVEGTIGVFAVSADCGLESDFDGDPYLKMMAQLIADRLAEATAERLHEQVRKELWGYAPDEQLSTEELMQEHFQGIRPAVGYPSLPDASINFILDRILNFNRIGIALTENGAMRPHASVSGLMLGHPQAHYFAVGKIGSDQLHDYARRRGLPVKEIRRFLAANL